jgi:hypothetical protein
MVCVFAASGFRFFRAPSPEIIVPVRTTKCVIIDVSFVYVPWYIGTTMKPTRYKRQFVVQRVQTGVRIEKRLLKVLKALAEYHDLTLGNLLEGIALHAFDGKAAFQKPSRRRIKELKKFYGLNLDYRASHRLIEARAVRPKPKTKPARNIRRTNPSRPAQRTRGAK